MYKTIYTEVEVVVDLSEFDTEDLIEELKHRDDQYVPTNGLIETIFEKRRTGQDFLRELDDLIYNTIGRIV
jgi:hypothetical protein